MQEKDFVFGIHSVLETLIAGKQIDKILIQRETGSSTKLVEILEEAQKQSIPVVKAPLEKLNKVTRKNHQGIIAYLSPIRFVSLDTIIQNTFEKGETPFVLVLDRITDVRNFGAIVRTAECAGVHAIVVPERGAAQIGSDAMKTSSGALNFVPICKEPDLKKSIQYLQSSGLQIIACTEKTNQNIYQVDFKIPVALVMGSEEDGISDDLLKKADELARIPLLGNIASLNVSVSAGIALYEVVRQRGI